MSAEHSSTKTGQKAVSSGSVDDDSPGGKQERDPPPEVESPNPFQGQSESEDEGQPFGQFDPMLKRKLLSIALKPKGPARTTYTTPLKTL